MSVASQVSRLSSAKTSLVGAIRTQGVTVPSSASISDLSSLVLKIPTIKTGSITLTSTAQTKTVNVGFKPTNVLVFYSQHETSSSARGVFGWSRTDLFSGVVDYIKTASATRTTWSHFVIGNQNDYLAFTSNGFTVKCVTTTSPIMVGTYNWLAW